MSELILFNKPFGVLSQFTDPEGRATLADHIPLPDCYPAGRLDRDSEGLLLLTNDGALQHRIAHPSQKLPKTYWVQVEGTPDDVALQALRKGVLLDDGMTRPAKAERMETPDLWERDPPVPVARHGQTSWISLTITEGRNRQVRRMTAAVGHPTLRLVRQAIGPWSVEGLKPGEYRKEIIHLPNQPDKSRKYR
ncbi:MAG: pseudouridine synthase [Gammaproteobacteria bacterium]|nr:MAG: pseudouridine synthase [Gammaproteobacteria bacterium]